MMKERFEKEKDPLVQYQVSYTKIMRNLLV